MPTAITEVAQSVCKASDWVFYGVVGGVGSDGWPKMYL